MLRILIFPFSIGPLITLVKRTSYEDVHYVTSPLLSTSSLLRPKIFFPVFCPQAASEYVQGRDSAFPLEVYMLGWSPIEPDIPFLRNGSLTPNVYTKHRHAWSYTFTPPYFMALCLIKSLVLVVPTWSIGYPRKTLFHFSFLILRQSVGLLGREISPSQGSYIHRTTQTQNKRTQTSIPWIWIWTHDPSVRASEGSSCPKRRGHCDRFNWV
jgi:hypothetical protein